MKKLVLLLCMFFITELPLAQAQWLHNGIPVTDSSYAKTKGDFGAMLVFTDKPDELFTAWNKDTVGVSANFDVEEIKENSSLTAAIIFSNCTPDEKGMANVTVKFTVLDPNGNIINKTGETEVWVNRPAPQKRELQLSVGFIQIQVGEKFPNSFYTMKALVHDKNSDTKIDLERKFKAVEDKQSSRFTWVKIISTPRANKNEIVPKSTKGFRHMAIVSDILPQKIWEVGPDAKGKIATTNTIADLSTWPTHLVTQKCIELNGDFVQSKFVEVNKKGLLEAIKMYEDYWVGEKYSRDNHNENYAVGTVIYAAGGDIRKAKKAPQN